MTNAKENDNKPIVGKSPVDPSKPPICTHVLNHENKAAACATLYKTIPMNHNIDDEYDGPFIDDDMMNRYFMRDKDIDVAKEDDIVIHSMAHSVLSLLNLSRNYFNNLLNKRSCDSNDE